MTLEQGVGVYCTKHTLSPEYTCIVMSGNPRQNMDIFELHLETDPVH